MPDVGRFYKIQPGMLPSPGKCSVCGSADRECIGFGLNIKFYGNVIICVVCLAEAAQQLTIEEINDRTASLDMKQRALEATGKRVQDGLASIATSLNRDLYLIGLGISPDEVTSESEPSIDEKPVGFLGKI